MVYMGRLGYERRREFRGLSEIIFHYINLSDLNEKDVY
jgi:hypothetical protein